MQQYPTDNLRIRATQEVVPAKVLHERYPITEEAARTVYETRQQIHRILHGEDDRLLVVIGPCSVHDPKAALEYAERLLEKKQELADDLLVVMRVYFEKPRTTVGWKGLINDPNLDDSYQINKGLEMARSLLLDINSMGLPAGTEFLDLISPQYVADLVSWGAIGARTTESQGHRELASGLSCPVGFKNGTDGTMRVAVDAMRAAERPHVFMSMTKEGHSAIFSTTGNNDTHIILRGGKRPNYDAESVKLAAEEMEKSGLTPRLMIDFSHANSHKQYEKQLEVGRDVAGQITHGDIRIIGAMIESHLVEGNQPLIPGKPLVYGQSITDACLSWEHSAPLLDDLAKAVRKRRAC
ncbi:3-deoxy-7-phosphoheptulonate synthase AroG [Thiolapillus brandeum]|uniref:Phospho-2-dehydro-3-deoxyheptonate aldolase n=1 Tax=Thiolapillus brandeum TaxID=1076588 RepID=A0A7U6GHW9_9GAMM|nr:3-deoxy-7-phosphoheptulonate synthase AroG [Thiolapillus brandeum]BAO43917.1 3-deoxy-7-phosphoheptulonate synthase [Thiolapillus brandeum]